MWARQVVKTISSGKKTGGDFLSACVSRMGTWLYCIAEDQVSFLDQTCPSSSSTAQFCFPLTKQKKHSDARACRVLFACFCAGYVSVLLFARR